ncbi:carboxypeptidase S1 [Arthroderma uncinatum]|uniref:carboxypeptidase S1 n=1 Tax=Arthroderma uncinatum TaxID=74035 RepID=UPI00144A6111|nr:carboxypeptidase S1 [Arthroderma uncinatum]KAF3481026.1 carboxypeptidase S1 [Arthroderma uncinatum]
MLSFARAALCLLAAAGPLVQAQFPPKPEGVTVLDSKFGNGVRISYKEPGLCETTEGVKSYAGYVHLPPGTLKDLGVEQDYPINTFFWFFEARKDPENAPLAIWMNGGPGSSSMFGMLTENGPCFVNPDSNSTTLNPHSWNNEVNMLYLDQPVQVGLSYDTLANFTRNLVTDTITKLEPNDPIPEQNATFLVGTYASRDGTKTAQGTRNAAIALWHFAQVWFQEFPGYHPRDSRISIATESYGGRYGPAFTAFFEEQNQKIKNGTWKGNQGNMHLLHLDTLMIVNGCIDRQVQWPAYPQMVFNNTYGIEAVNASVHQQMLDALYRDGGCRDKINDCRAISAVSDPENIGINATVNEACSEAETFCATELDPSPFPAPFYMAWLNQPHVQAALGVPLNWTQSNDVVSTAFRAIGDYPRPGWLENLAYLLENGIKVSLVYGDRDYACNWFGGELSSLAINYTDTRNFHAAGYAGIQVNNSYIGGQVRQYGNLSFSRVYEAGHEVPSYQPDTALKIFHRALFNKDIATGTIDTSVPVNGDRQYGSSGPPDSFRFKNEPPAQHVHFCHVLDTSTCTQEQLKAVENGTALVRNWIVVDSNSTSLFPEVVGSPTPTPSPAPGTAAGLSARSHIHEVAFLGAFALTLSALMF